MATEINYQIRLKLLEQGACGCQITQKKLFLSQRDCLNTLQGCNNLLWLKCIKYILDTYVPQTKIINNNVFLGEDLPTETVDDFDLETKECRVPNSKNQTYGSHDSFL